MANGIISIHTYQWLYSYYYCDYYHIFFFFHRSICRVDVQNFVCISIYGFSFFFHSVVLFDFWSFFSYTRTPRNPITMVWRIMCRSVGHSRECLLCCVKNFKAVHTRVYKHAHARTHVEIILVGTKVKYQFARLQQ